VCLSDSTWLNMHETLGFILSTFPTPTKLGRGQPCSDLTRNKQSWGSDSSCPWVVAMKTLLAHLSKSLSCAIIAITASTLAGIWVGLSW
jgi:hypothetical protein